MINKPLLVLLLTVIIGLNASAQDEPIIARINSMRDDVYTKLQNQQISLDKARLIYKNQEKRLFNDKKYPYYIQCFLFEAVDFYVTKDDYENAAKSVLEGMSNLKYISGVSRDTLFFQLNAELAEYYRRIPNKLNLAEKHFKIGYDFLLKKKWIENQMPAFVITFLSNYGRLVDDLGDSEQAFNYFQQAKQIGQQKHITLNMYAVLSNMAKYYREKKDYANALKLLQEALPLTESDDKTSAIYLAIARCYQQMKKPSDALKALNDSEVYYRKSKETQPRQWVNILTQRAEALLSMNNVESAEKKYQQALEIFIKNFKHQKGVQVARIENGLSEVYKQKGLTGEALIHCEKALKAADTTHQKSTFSFERIIAPQEYFVALTQKADLLATTSPKLSAETYLQTISFISRLRQTFDMPESKLFYSEKVYPVYEKALENIYQLWIKTQDTRWSNAFFDVIEASKAATLGDVVKENSIRPKNLDTNLLAEEARLRQKIVKLQVKLLDSGNEKTLADLSDAKIKLNHLINKIESSSKEYYQLKYENKKISVQDVQKKLGNNTAFISYFLGDHALYYIALNNKSFQLIKANNVQNIKKTLALTYQNINTPPGIDAYKGHFMAQRAHQYLIKPIEKTLKDVHKIIVSRHEIIGYLPFEVLEPKAKADYLVYKYTFSYANSASLHFDSFLSKQNAEIIAYAPFSNGAEAGRFRDQGFKALPASANEITGINGQILQDKQATKINFQESYQDKGIIHFATHAQVDDQDPSKSFIALFPDGKDFRLYTPELYNLSLHKTQLVVLSACETGKGKIRKGEGIISLARAFQFAGCPSVITTIWNAHDESMSLLSQHFYYYLQKGLATDEAIRYSKIDLIRTYSDHPFYWSNFILIGQSNPIDLPSNLNLYLILSIGAILVILAWSLRQRIIRFFLK
ncbi:Tetratricopeptide TPR_1 repeat-containing protein [Emticicia oligotrophica DSM 17448]|uniref:Tetratricopeptide TPR_1 repeat-containing protein n=1 Tax=Emticicia oligotrophica (strain DSM 17448 / CIP 109782 / MTCC 6937 / GPTSA100-15) TaxID=929562 RepID=A0ABM5N3I4_EMTOG|nr:MULTISPECIES: CHAT domain-containing protein [Emticicia]AFK04005.1 Tetratricopeptide TPR_1 repeat-containing protein [Emticicia oligotrophica DSM 17448]